MRATPLILVLMMALLGGCAAGPARCERHLVPINVLPSGADRAAGRTQP